MMIRLISFFSSSTHLPTIVSNCNSYFNKPPSPLFRREALPLPPPPPTISQKKTLFCKINSSVFFSLKNAAHKNCMPDKYGSGSRCDAVIAYRGIS